MCLTTIRSVGFFWVSFIDLGSILFKSSHAELIVMKYFPQFRSELRAKTISHKPPTTHMTRENPNLCECGRAGGAEDLLVADTGNTVGKRERETLGDELSDVRALDVVNLLDLDNAQDLGFTLADAVSSILILELRTWMDRKRARWRAAMSW